MAAAQQLHSASQAASPGAGTAVPCNSLIWPKTDSMACCRLAKQALPSSLASSLFVAARSPSLRDADGLPSLPGLL